MTIAGEVVVRRWSECKSGAVTVENSDVVVQNVKNRTAGVIQQRRWWVFTKETKNTNLKRRPRSRGQGRPADNLSVCRRATA